MPDQLQPGIRKSCDASSQLSHFELEIMSSPQSLENWYSLMEDNETRKIEIRSPITVGLILAELTSQLSISLITIL